MADLLSSLLAQSSRDVRYDDDDRASDDSNVVDSDASVEPKTDSEFAPNHNFESQDSTLINYAVSSSASSSSTSPSETSSSSSDPGSVESSSASISDPPSTDASCKEPGKKKYALLLGCVYANEFTPKRGQEYRDRVRCEALERIGYEVYTLDDKHEETRESVPGRHCKANFSDARRMAMCIRQVWGYTISFDVIILDYFFSPVSHYSPLHPPPPTHTISLLL